MSVEPLREFLKFPEPRFLLLCLVKHTMDVCDSSSNSCFSSEGESDCDCAGVSFPRPEESPSLFSLKLTSFWQTKGDFSSPVGEHRPEEWFAYRALSALPEEIKSSELLAFAERVGEGIASCRCEGVRLKSADRRAVLVASAISKLRHNDVLRKLLCDVFRKAGVSVDTVVIGAIVASTVEHVWTLRGKQTYVSEGEVSAVPEERTVQVLSSVSESEKIKYHAGWTLKRVRDRLLVSRGKTYEVLREGGDRSHCTGDEVLCVLARLAKDCEMVTRHLLQPDSATCSFFHHLHVFAEKFFSEEVS